MDLQAKRTAKVRCRTSALGASHETIEALRTQRKRGNIHKDLAERGIMTSTKALRTYEKHVLRRGRLNASRKESERMYGILQRWAKDDQARTRNIVVLFLGNPRPEAALKLVLKRPYKGHVSTSPELADLIHYSGPTPSTIFYYDENDPSTDLLALDGCPWAPEETDEALSYLPESTKRMCTTLRRDSGTSESRDSALTVNGAITPVPPLSTTPSLLSAIDSNAGAFNAPQGDAFLSIDDDEQIISAFGHLIQILLENGKLDEAREASNSAILASQTFSSDLQNLANVFKLSVDSYSGDCLEAPRKLKLAVDKLRDHKGLDAVDVLDTERRYVEALIEAEDLDTAREYSESVLARSRVYQNVTAEQLGISRLQAARIYEMLGDHDASLKQSRLLLREHSQQRDPFSDDTTVWDLSNDLILRAFIQMVQTLCAMKSSPARAYAYRFSDWIQEELATRELRGFTRTFWSLEFILSIGSLQYTTGAYYEAEQTFTIYASKIKSKCGSENHPKFIHADNLVACTLHCQGFAHAAANKFDSLRSSASDVWGPYHPITLTLQSNLAWTCEQTSSLDVFEREMSLVRTLRQENLEAGHADLLDSELDYAYVKSLRGQWSTSLSAVDSVRRTRSLSRPKQHELTVQHGQILVDKGAYRDAVPLLYASMEEGEQVFGQNHPAASTALVPLTRALLALNRLDEAEALLRKYKTLLQGSLGCEHERVLDIDKEWALFKAQCGRHLEALEIFEKLFKLYSARLKPHHPYIVNAAQNLSEEYLAMKRFPEARHFVAQALRDNNAAGKGRFYTTMTLKCLEARIAMAEGEIDLARSLANKAVAFAESVLGTCDLTREELFTNVRFRSLFEVFWSLALSEDSLGNYAKSVKLLEKLLKLRTTFWGASHPCTLKAGTALVRAYDSSGEFGKALTLSFEIANQSSDVLGEWHPLTVRRKALWAGSLSQMEMFTQSEAVYKTILGHLVEHEDQLLLSERAWTYNNLANMYGAQEKFVDALAHQRIAVDLYRACNDTGNIVRVQNGIAAYCLCMGDYQKAKTMALRAQRQAESVLGPRDPSVFRAKLTYGMALLDNCELSQCQKHAQQLCRDIRTAQGRDSELLMEAEHLYGKSLQQQDLTREAETHLEACVHISSRQRMKTYSLTKLQFLLSDIKGDLEKYDDKAELLQGIMARAHNEIAGSQPYFDALVELTDLQVDRKDYDGAARLAAKALEYTRQTWGAQSEQSFDAELCFLRCHPPGNLEEMLILYEDLTKRYATIWSSQPDRRQTTWRIIARRCDDDGQHSTETEFRLLMLSEARNGGAIRSLDDSWDLGWLGEALYQMGAYEEAETVLELVADPARNPFFAHPSVLHRAVWDLALCKISLEKPEDAIVALERGLKAVPGSKLRAGRILKFLDYLVMCASKLGRWALAKEAVILLHELEADFPLGEEMPKLSSAEHWEEIVELWHMLREVDLGHFSWWERLPAAKNIDIVAQDLASEGDTLSIDDIWLDVHYGSVGRNFP